MFFRNKVLENMEKIGEKKNLSWCVGQTVEVRTRFQIMIIMNLNKGRISDLVMLHVEVPTQRHVACTSVKKSTTKKDGELEWQ